MTNNKAFPPIMETISISTQARKTTEPSRLLLSDQLHQDGRWAKEKKQAGGKDPGSFCAVLFSSFSSFSPTETTQTSEQFSGDCPASLRRLHSPHWSASSRNFAPFRFRIYFFSPQNAEPGHDLRSLLDGWTQSCNSAQHKSTEVWIGRSRYSTGQYSSENANLV